MKVRVGDRDVEGEDLAFKTTNEPWVDYQLEDGGLVRVRLIVTNIVRTTEVNDMGAPLVAIQSKTVVAYRPPGAST